MSAGSIERVSVVVPTYNAAGHLQTCLTSLARAREPEAEVETWVVDGGSTDGTVDVAREHGAEVLEAPGTGVAEARNLGAREAGGDALLFLDADCRAPETLLEATVDRLAEHAAAGAFYRPAPDAGWVARTWLALEAKPGGPTSWVPAGTLAVRREAFAEVGGFDGDLGASEDVDLCRRLRARGHVVYHDPRMACEHLGQADSLSAFFETEVWRSQSLLASVRRSGGLDGEAVTALLALFHLAWPLLVALAGLWGWRWLGAALGLGLAPSLAWATWAVPRTGWRAFPAALALLVAYNAARAYSLVEHGQFADLAGSRR